MPRGDNPNSRANLKPASQRSLKEARENGRKGGKKSGEVRREYASLRDCFKQRLDDDKKDEIFDMLFDLAIKRKNLNALDRLTKLLGEDQPKEEKSSGGGNVIFMPERSDGDE